MPSILLPEEEAVVTPGPKAVQDLEDIGAPTGKPIATHDPDWYYLEDVHCALEKDSFEVYSKLAMARQPLHQNGLPRPATLQEAEQVESPIFVPSSGIQLALLIKAYSQVRVQMIWGHYKYSAERTKNYENLIGSYQGRRFLCNTIVDWEREQIVNYPTDEQVQGRSAQNTHVWWREFSRVDLPEDHLIPYSRGARLHYHAWPLVLFLSGSIDAHKTRTFLPNHRYSILLPEVDKREGISHVFLTSDEKGIFQMQVGDPGEDTGYVRYVKRCR